MNNILPTVAFGHFVMKVSDIDISYQFYTKLGFRPFVIYPDLPIQLVQAAQPPREVAGHGWRRRAGCRS